MKSTIYHCATCHARNLPPELRSSTGGHHQRHTHIVFRDGMTAPRVTAEIKEDTCPGPLRAMEIQHGEEIVTRTAAHMLLEAEQTLVDDEGAILFFADEAWWRLQVELCTVAPVDSPQLHAV